MLTGEAVSYTHLDVYKRQICQVLKGKEKNTVIRDAFRGQELLIKAMNKVKTDENARL